MENLKRLFLFLALALILAACGPSGSAVKVPENPEDVVRDFIEAYRQGDQETITALSLGGENLLQEMDKVLDIMHYDDGSRKALGQGIRTFDYTLGEVTAKGDGRAQVHIIIDSHQYDEVAVENLKDVFRKEDFTFAPIKEDFSDLRPMGEDYGILLKKEEGIWQVDLTSEDNKSLVNTLSGHFLEEGRMRYHQQLAAVFVSEDLKPTPRPNDTITLKRGQETTTYKTNLDQREDGLALPFYGDFLLYGKYDYAWDEDTTTLILIKDTDMITLPFKEVKVAMYHVPLWDMTQAGHENIEILT